jgi:hypothetical protein
MMPRSRRVRVLLAASSFVAFGVLASGCVIEEHHHGGPGRVIVPPTNVPPISVPPIPDCPVESTSADNAAIDVNDANGIDSPPGEGAGVLVDYDAGGHWHIWSVCDTSLSGIACGFSVTALALGGNAVTNVTGDDLEAGERAGTTCAGSAFYTGSTDFGVDGMRFDTAPGAAVQVEAALDGTVFPDVIFFAQTGTAVTSATNPLTLTPASP